MWGSCTTCTIAIQEPSTPTNFFFKSIAEGTHDHIHMRWMQNDPENPTMFDLNCNAKHLAFVVNGNNIFAKRKNEVTGRVEPITRETFATIVDDVKTQCSGMLTLPLSSLCLFACTCYSIPLVLCICCYLHVWLSNILCVHLWFCCRGCRAAHTRAPTQFPRTRSLGCVWHHLPAILVATK